MRDSITSGGAPNRNQPSRRSPCTAGARFPAGCPSRLLFEQVTDKWSMMVLTVVREPRRFNAIKRRLDGVTQRVLTQTLRKLERNARGKRPQFYATPGMDEAMSMIIHLS